MIALKMNQASKLLSESKAVRTEVRKKPRAVIEDDAEKIDFKEIEDDTYEVMSNILAVGLAQIEDMTGLSFEDSKEAQDFLFKAFAGLRSKGRGKLANALRKFDRLGGDQTKKMFRRQIAK